MKQIATLSILFLFLGISANAQNTNTQNHPLTGIWQCVAHGSKNGDIPFTLHLEQSNENISGWVSAPEGSADITSASFANNHLQIEIDTNEDQYKLSATLRNGKLTGTWEHNEQEKGTWEGKKSSDPEAVE